MNTDSAEGMGDLLYPPPLPRLIGCLTTNVGRTNMSIYVKITCEEEQERAGQVQTVQTVQF